MAEYSIYELYIKEHEREISEGREFVAEVRDISDFRSIVARVRVAPSPEQLGTADKLWIRGFNQEVYPEPWGIQILEELEDFESMVTGDAGPGSAHTIKVEPMQ